MKRTSPWLLPLLRTQTQGELLAWLYLHPERDYSLTDLAGRFGVSSPTVMREANRLVAAGLLNEERRGNQRLLSARTDTPVYQQLADLLAVTYGPVPVLTDLLSEVEGIAAAYIYGSWAARFHQQPGGVPADIDVLVVGRADPDAVYDAAEAASRLLGRDVSAHQVSAEAWAEDVTDPFLASVRQRPLVQLQLERVAP